MPPNADLYSRIELRLFRSYFDFNRSGYFTQGRSGIGLISRSRGKFWQANGLGSGVVLLVVALVVGAELTSQLPKDLNDSSMVLTFTVALSRSCSN